MYISTDEAVDDDDNLTNSGFLTNLNRGELTVPLIFTVDFIHSAHKSSDGQPLSRIDCLMAIIQGACVTLSNILLKSFVLDNSYKERQFGCLKRKEKSHFKTKLQ